MDFPTGKSFVTGCFLFTNVLQLFPVFTFDEKLFKRLHSVSYSFLQILPLIYIYCYFSSLQQTPDK